MSTGLTEGQGVVLWPSTQEGLSAPPGSPVEASQLQPWAEQTPGAQGTESPHCPVEPTTWVTSARDCRHCPGGRACRKCRNGVYDLARPLYSSYGCGSAEYLRHKRARFLVRCFAGVACGMAKGFRFRWFVLTESDEAILAGADFGHEFHKLVTWLRYQCPSFEYCCVEHLQGKVSKVSGKQRHNRHVLSYGSDKLPVLGISDYWREHYLSTVTGMEEIRSIGASAKYLAGYVSNSEKFIRAWCSQGWVFRGWLGLTRKYRRQFGEYPSRQVLVCLSGMPRVVCEGEMEFLLQTGYLLGDIEWSRSGEDCELGREKWQSRIGEIDWEAVWKARDEFNGGMAETSGP